MTFNTDATVLVPGAAGAAGIDAIKALRRGGFKGRIIATDGEPLAAGFEFSDGCYVTYSIDDPVVYRRMVDILIKERVRVILPTALTDTAAYSQHKRELAEAGIVFAGCDGSVVKLCDDKLAFFESVRHAFPIPNYIELRDAQPAKYPCFVKPRWGSGGHGCGLCNDITDFRFYSKYRGELLVQEFLPGSEYSVDVLSNMSGEPLLAVPRERLAVRDSVSVRARVIRDLEIEQMCLKMARALGLKGVTCMQLKRDNTGALKFLEVNAHMAGSAIVSMLAGVDLVGILLAMALGNDFDVPGYREITVTRHLEAVVVKDTSRHQ